MDVNTPAVSVVFRYIDDIPPARGELYGALVVSTHTHAMITVDASEVEKMEGVRAFVSANDIPGNKDISELPVKLL